MDWVKSSLDLKAESEILWGELRHNRFCSCGRTDWGIRFWKTTGELPGGGVFFEDSCGGEVESWGSCLEVFLEVKFSWGWCLEVGGWGFFSFWWVRAWWGLNQVDKSWYVFLDIFQQGNFLQNKSKIQHINFAWHFSKKEFNWKQIEDPTCRFVLRRRRTIFDWHNVFWPCMHYIYAWKFVWWIKSTKSKIVSHFLKSANITIVW